MKKVFFKASDYKHDAVFFKVDGGKIKASAEEESALINGSIKKWKPVFSDFTASVQAEYKNFGFGWFINGNRATEDEVVLFVTQN